MSVFQLRSDLTLEKKGVSTAQLGFESSTCEVAIDMDRYGQIIYSKPQKDRKVVRHLFSAGVLIYLSGGCWIAPKERLSVELYGASNLRRRKSQLRFFLGPGCKNLK